MANQFTFADAMKSAAEASRFGTTQSEIQLGYAVWQLASALQTSIKELNQRLDQLQRQSP